MLPNVSFYFLRHGKTQPNLDGLMCGGGWDVPLCDEGRAQAERVARVICPTLLPTPKIIFTSPMIRAVQTASYVFDVLPLPLIMIAQLREWGMGDWDGRPFTEVKDKFLGMEDPSNGESRSHFRIRVEGALKRLLLSDSLPLIVSHGGVGLMIQEILGLPRARIDNCELFRFFSNEMAEWSLQKLS